MDYFYMEPFFICSIQNNNVQVALIGKDTW